MKPGQKEQHGDKPRTDVACSHSEMVGIETLVPHPQNPNRHSEEQILLLAKIIRHQGWRAPIVVSKRSGFIVAGHARLEAAKQIGLKQVPADFQEFTTEEDELAHLIADNRIAELAETEFSTIAEILKAMPAAFDMTLTGFKDHELENLLKADWNPPAIEPFETQHERGESIHLTKEQLERFKLAKAKVLEEMPKASDGQALAEICAQFLAIA